jgi:ABC-type transport system substrate-binding protein
MKRWAWLALVLSGALLAACGPVGDDGSSPGGAPEGGALRNGGTLTVALMDDPDKLDPTLARTLVGRSVFTSLCEKLYDIDANISSFHLSQGSQNISRAGDKPIDQMILQARASSDVSRRKQLYGQIIRAVQQRDNVIYLYRLKTYIGTTKKVGGVNVYADSLVRVAFAGLTAS